MNLPVVQKIMVQPFGSNKLDKRKWFCKGYSFMSYGNQTADWLLGHNGSASVSLLKHSYYNFNSLSLSLSSKV